MITKQKSRIQLRFHLLVLMVLVSCVLASPVLAEAAGDNAVSKAEASVPPFVSDTTSGQQAESSRLVDTSYDPADADGDACTVTVLTSNDQGSYSGMVRIPGGEYEMGDHHDGMVSALPVHTVNINAFYLDTYEVTNQEYCDGLNWAWAQGGLIEVDSGVVYKAGSGTSYPYCDTTSSYSYSRIIWDGSTFTVTTGKEDHPMVEVSWFGAVAYANWQSAMKGLTPSYDTSTWDCNFSADGYRLPTEAEWEKAARGGEHDPYYRYPWGDVVDDSQANYLYSNDPYEVGDYPWTTPVGYYDGNQTPPGTDMANGYGLYDMAGNVFEWCNDWYDSNYYSVSPFDNPQGPAVGTYRAFRGGSWNYYEERIRCARRYGDGTDPDTRHYDGGFRLAADVGNMLLIPTGAYEMGDHHDDMSDALPVHTVNIYDFLMGTYEVTNQEYCDGLNWALAQGGLIELDSGVVYEAGSAMSYPYCDTTTSSSYSRIVWTGSTFTVTAGKEDHPMVMVSWFGAVAYANWQSAMKGLTPSYDTSTWDCNFSAGGYRLPTEAEWEKAVRGGEHDPYYRYPWGDTIDGSQANYDGSGDPYETGDYPWTTPVGYYDGNQTPPGTDMANDYGLYDTVGNVWEWCNDWYDSNYYNVSRPDNPHGPITGTYRVLRGGSWNAGEDRLRCARRFGDGTNPNTRHHDGGFRLLQSPDFIDCNENGIVDATDIAEGTSEDLNGNDVPDECEAPAICRTPEVLATSCFTGHDAASQAFEVWNCGVSVSTLTYSITDDVAWLACDPAGGDSTGEHDTIAVFYSTAGLSEGIYTATITITDPAASNDPQTIPVTLTVASQPSICLDPIELYPSCELGEDAESQSFDLWNCGETGSTLEYTISDDVEWLSCQPESGDSTGEADSITVSYSTSSLTVGSYIGTITIEDPDADNTPQTIDVDLTVTTCYPIGGAIFDDEENPLSSGVGGVTVTVTGDGGTFTACTSEDGQGIWIIEDVPVGTYTVTPSITGCTFQHFVGGEPTDPPPITIIVDEAHEEENGNIKFLATCADGACCLGGDTCFETNRTACTGISGAVFQGYGTTCGTPCEYDDCNENGVLDAVDITTCLAEDCQPNGVPDACDIADGTSNDANLNGIPDECEGTISADLTCVPPSGTVPFSTTMTAMMTNNYTGLTRRLAGRIDVVLAGGQSYSNWKSGWSNVDAGDSLVRTWNQSIPALGSVIGDNVFTLLVEDVTPSPYNQPPHPMSGDTDVDNCTVAGIAP